MTSTPTPEDLVKYFHEGTLSSEISQQFGLTSEVEISEVIAACVALHNSGALDLLRIVESGELQKLERFRFFSAMHFLCKLLPSLVSTPERLMASVESLVAQGGDDMAATQPNAAFRTWCSRNLHHAREVISAARKGDALASRHLTFALEAVSDIAEARNIAGAYGDDRRLSAITALSRIKDPDSKSRTLTLNLFRKIANHGADDSLRANLLLATMSILDASGSTPSAANIKLIGILVKDGGDVTIHQCAHVLWAFRHALQPKVVSHLLDALLQLNPTNKGTVNELDHGLTTLLGIGHGEAAVKFVTTLLSKADVDLQLENLDGFTNSLLNGPREQLSKVVVQWLLLGSPRLCNGLFNALQGKDLSGPPLEIQPQDVTIPPAAQVFLCRKAIGWFFVKPVSAASILVSVLRVCTADTAKKVQNLLVEALLLNYGSVQKFLASLPSSDPAKAHIDEALKQSSNYIRALGEVTPIAELRPSEYHRRIEKLRMREELLDAQKQAEEKSVFLKFIRRSVLLYGARSVSYVRDAPDKLRPVEIELQQHGVSIEVPRAEIVDPVGLDLMIRIFRAERLVP